MVKFTFLSWNLAMFQRPDFAPKGWRTDQTEAAVRRLVMEVDPDFVLFQELPGLIPYIETHDMLPANAKGQSGDIATLARHNLIPDITASRLDNTVLTHVGSSDLTIANVHLPSSSGGDQDRLRIIEDIQSANPNTHLAIIGDTNTRTKEEDGIASLGLNGERPPEPTWNGRVNKFRRDDRNFTAYFTRAFHSANVQIGGVKVWTQPLVEKAFTFHISDHFAMSGQISTSDKNKSG